MTTIGMVLKMQSIDPALSEYLKNIPQDKIFNFRTIREHIESGSGRFTEAEEIFLLLEGVIKRYKGEPGW
ncbi:MAG: hypothetical protein HZA08_00460 [Nitrospirae bacterium]|nr:hypothetical protein [Nitrospirota bacterium]